MQEKHFDTLKQRICYIKRIGQPLLGRINNNDRNLYIYQQEWRTIYPEIESWLSKYNKRNNLDIQNEILKILANSMQHALLGKKM